MDVSQKNERSLRGLKVVGNRSFRKDYVKRCGGVWNPPLLVAEKVQHRVGYHRRVRHLVENRRSHHPGRNTSHYRDQIYVYPRNIGGCDCGNRLPVRSARLGWGQIQIVDMDLLRLGRFRRAGCNIPRETVFLVIWLFVHRDWQFVFFLVKGASMRFSSSSLC